MAALDFQSKKLIPDYEINSGINFFFYPSRNSFLYWGNLRKIQNYPSINEKLPQCKRSILLKTGVFSQDEPKVRP